MTRPAGQRFGGAWMNPTIPDSLLAATIANHPGGGSINTKRVLEILGRQMEVWRFDLERRNTEPQPAQWAGLVRKIVIPADPELIDVMQIDYETQLLPAQVLGALSHELYRRCNMSRLALFDRVRAGEIELLDTLREVLNDMAGQLDYIRGKTGPQADIGPAFRAVHAALLDGSDLKDGAARELTGELLNMCGIPAPRSRSRQAELIAG